MKELLLKLLNLKDSPDAEALILHSVEGLVTESKKLRAENETLRQENDELLEAPPETDAAKLEKRINQKISQSGGALNREQAVIAIQHQDEAAAKKSKKK